MTTRALNDLLCTGHWWLMLIFLYGLMTCWLAVELLTTSANDAPLVLGVCRGGSQGHCFHRMAPALCDASCQLTAFRPNWLPIDWLCPCFYHAGLLAPTLVQFEQEIDQELENDHQESMIKRTLMPPTDVSALLGDSELIFDDTPQQQITNNDLESLHEKVSLILLIDLSA